MTLANASQSKLKCINFQDILTNDVDYYANLFNNYVETSEFSISLYDGNASHTIFRIPSPPNKVTLYCKLNKDLLSLVGNCKNVLNPERFMFTIEMPYYPLTEDYITQLLGVRWINVSLKYLLDIWNSRKPSRSSSALLH